MSNTAEKRDDEVYLAKKLMDAIDNGSNDQLPELLKIAHLNPKIFVHCEKYFQIGIENDIDKYECMNDYGLIQMLKGNDPSEYFKKSYEEGQSENGLFNYAVFTKRKDLLKESADKHANPMSMLLYYQLSNDIDYLEKSAIKYKNPFALTLYGLYKIEKESESDKNTKSMNTNNDNDDSTEKDTKSIDKADKDTENKVNIKANDNDNKDSTESNQNDEKSQVKDENPNDNTNDNETISEEEEESNDDNYMNGQQILTEAAILTKPGDKFNLLPFPSVLFYSKEFVNECKNNIKRAADSGNPHCSFLYAYMCTDPQEKAKYYKFAGDKGLSDGYFHYYKLVKKNSSLFSPGKFENLERSNSIEKSERSNPIENKKQNIISDSKDVDPSNFEFEMKRFVGEMDGFIDFQRSIFDITINNVPTVSQNIVSTIVDVKSVYKLVHNIMLAVDYRPFEQNLNALANLATSVHFLIFDEYLQNLFRDLLIQEACSNTSRNRSRFFFIELCIENFMFSMDYFCKAVSYIKQFRQNVNYNRYVELWFPEVRKFIIKIERENQKENEEEESEAETENKEENETENKEEKEKDNKNEDETENKEENDNKNENENKTENKEENDNENETENKVKNMTNNKEDTNKTINDDKTTNKKESKKVEDDDDFIDLNYFFDTKKHIDDTNHNTQPKSNHNKNNNDDEENPNNEDSFQFLPFRDSTLVSSSYIISHRKQGNPDPLSQAIRHDDINKLKRLLMQGKKTNINARIQPSFFELSSMLDKRPSLLSYCAFFNAERCFSFLVDNEADTLVFDDECLTVSAYAAASGSTKILARLEAVNELEHQEAAEFASRFHRGRILKRLMSGKTMCGAAAEEMKENQKSIANELLERQRRQMMQELQIRRILVQQQKFIQQQEMINQRNMKLQQEEQKLKLERFLIQQQQKIRIQQELQKKQNEQQKEAEKSADPSKQTEKVDKDANENTGQNSSANNSTENHHQQQTNNQTETSNTENQQQTNNQTETPNTENQQQTNNQTETPNTENQQQQTNNLKETSITETRTDKQAETSSSSQISSSSTIQDPEHNNSQNQPTDTQPPPPKRSSFFGKYADLQKQVLLEQRKQQLLKQQQQDQQKSQAAQKASQIQAQTPPQDLSLPPALSRLVASQSQQNQEANFGTFHRRPNPYKQEPIEERRAEFVVRDGEPKVEEVEKVVVNGLLSDFVESLSYFDSNLKSKEKQKKTKKTNKKSNIENEEEEEEEDVDDDEEEEEINEEDEGLLPLFSEDLNGENSSSSIFYKICELGNSGVVHFFNQEIWKRMLIETVHGDGRETVLTRLAAIGNYDMLDEILRIKEVKKLINVANLNGNTPIEVATVNKHQNIVDIFESFLDEQE